MTYTKPTHTTEDQEALTKEESKTDFMQKVKDAFAEDVQVIDVQYNIILDEFCGKKYGR